MTPGGVAAWVECLRVIQSRPRRPHRHRAATRRRRKPPAGCHLARPVGWCAACFSQIWGATAAAISCLTPGLRHAVANGPPPPPGCGWWWCPRLRRRASRRRRPGPPLGSGHEPRSPEYMGCPCPQSEEAVAHLQLPIVFPLLEGLANPVPSWLLGKLGRANAKPHEWHDQKGTAAHLPKKSFPQSLRVRTRDPSKHTRPARCSRCRCALHGACWTWRRRTRILPV